MPSPEWVIERGIGETRAALIDQGGIIEVCIELEDAVPAGSVITGRLKDIGKNGRNAVAIGSDGAEYLLPHGAPGKTEGTALSIEVTRERIPGIEVWKRSLGRLTDKEPTPIASLAQRLGGREIVFPSPINLLGQAGWDELTDEARNGMISFTGGELRISPTPAMTLIDVDGYLKPEELAVAGACQAARAIRRLDIGGSVGIDLPTISGKAHRQAAAEAIDHELPQPFERTSVNGFGFVQIVRRRVRPSFIELAQDRAAFEARALLRRAAFETPGPKNLVAHPSVIAAFEKKRGWIAKISDQFAGAVGLRADATISISGGYAENA